MEQSLASLISLDGKTAIVTGAAKGIGKAIALRLNQAGANIVLVDIESEDLDRAAAEINQLRPNTAYAVNADVSQLFDVNKAVGETIEHFGGIDILINNAGIYPIKKLADMSQEDFIRVIDVNLKGIYLFTKAVSDIMKDQGRGGRIVNITSIDALHPSAVGLAHYDASKHGVWGFTKNVALELAEHKIWVNAVAPGGVATPGAAAAQDPTVSLDPEQAKQMQEAFLKRIPMHRMGEPDDIAKAVLFMTSDLASYITGSQLVVDGGALLN